MRPKIAHLLLSTVLAAVVLAVPAQARVGGLDKSFADHGRLAVKNSIMGVGRDGAIALIHGKRVLLLTPQGDRDTRFGGDGSVPVPSSVGGWSFSASHEALDSQGRLLLFGSAYPPGEPEVRLELESVPIKRAAVVRLLPDGRPDPEFGQGGAVLGDFGVNSEVPGVSESTTGIAAGAVDSLDRPLFVIGAAAGHVPCRAHTFTGWAPKAIVRLTPMGLPDPEFGEGDGLSPTFPKIEWLPGVTLATTTANQPLLGSALGVGCSRGASVIRLSDGGTPLPGYGTEGRQNFPKFKFVAFTPEGGAILERRRYATELVRRVIPQGQFDPGFGRGGVVSLKLRPNSSSYRPAAVVDSAGRILIVTSYSLPAAGPPAKRGFIVVERLLASGKRDLGFGRGGQITAPVPGARNIGELQLSLDPQGRLLVLSELTKPNEYRNGASVLTRFRLD